MPDYTFYQIALFFFIYAFLGWCCEVAFAAVKTGKFVNRGFLNGPVCPIYGFGLLAVIFTLYPVRNNLLLLFLASIFVTTLLEYITGKVLESVFHMKWWDYSNTRFNIGGYVCLEFSIIWGLSAVFVMKIIHPVIRRFVLMFSPTVGLVITVIAITAIMVDLICTVITIGKLQKKLSVITSLGSDMREFSDKLADVISSTVIRTVDAAVETKDMYSELFDMIEAHKAQEKALAEKNRAAEQELWESIRSVGKNRKQRYESLRKKRTEELNSKSHMLNRIVKAFPNMQVYGYEEAMKDLREYNSEKKDKKTGKK